MTSIRAPWRVRVPHVGRDGFDALPAIDGKPGKDGRDGERGQRGLRGLLLRAPEPEPGALAPLQPVRAEVFRDADTKLWTRVRVPPMSDGSPPIDLYAVRGEDDLIDYIDLIPEAA